MKQAMIFAAGLGTRLKPLTDSMPKALVPVQGVPLIERVVLKLKAAGIERMVVNVHHFAQQIVEFLAAHDNFGVDIRISDETSELLETGGGLKKALPLFDSASPILIHNVDILSNVDIKALYDLAEASKSDALLLVSKRKTKRYLLFDEENMLHGWTNVDTGELRSPYPLTDVDDFQKLAFSGIHVLLPSAFSLFSNMPKRFGVMDFYLKYCHQHSFFGYEQQDLQLIDVGKYDSLGDAEEFLNTLDLHL